MDACTGVESRPHRKHAQAHAYVNTMIAIPPGHRYCSAMSSWKLERLAEGDAPGPVAGPASTRPVSADCHVRMCNPGGLQTDLGDRRQSNGKDCLGNTPRCIGSRQDQHTDSHHHPPSLHSDPFPAIFPALPCPDEENKSRARKRMVGCPARARWPTSRAQAGGHCGRPVRVCCIHTASSEWSSAGVGADLCWRCNHPSQSLRPASGLVPAVEPGGRGAWDGADKGCRPGAPDSCVHVVARLSALALFPLFISLASPSLLVAGRVANRIWGPAAARSLCA